LTEGRDNHSRCVRYGLPTYFASEFQSNSYARRHIYDIRGHDFLSFGAKFKSDKGIERCLGVSVTPISESLFLESLRNETAKRASSKKESSRKAAEDTTNPGLDMTITFGSKPGSFFVDAFSIPRYGWANLPPDLDNLIQRIVCVKGYGDGVIKNVALNANGGWVMSLDEGSRFEFGGELPYDLRIVLQDAQKNNSEQPGLKITIEVRFPLIVSGNILTKYLQRIYLNHQHPQEYVLIFGEGQCFACLHSDFRDPLEKLLTTWATGNRVRRFVFNFKPSSTIGQDCQRLLNAQYYSRRGLFFLSRFNVELALRYLREAVYQDESNMEIRGRLAIGLVAVRRVRGRDPTLDALIERRPHRAPGHRPPPRPREHQDEGTMFRDEYMWMLDEDVELPALEQRLDEIQRPFLASNGKFAADGTLNEWSNDKYAIRREVFELGNAEQDPGAPNVPGAIEVEAGRTLSHEMPAWEEPNDAVARVWDPRTNDLWGTRANEHRGIRLFNSVRRKKDGIGS
jgi:hypothetical protein